MPYTYLNVRPLSSSSTATYGTVLAALSDLLQSAGWVYKASGIGTNTGTGSGFTNTSPTTVTLSSGTPGLVNWTTHGYHPNMMVTLSSTGTLPPEITANTPYYVANHSSFGASQFSISATMGGSPIAFSTSGSGTITAVMVKVITTVGATKSAVSGLISLTSPAVVNYDSQPHGLNPGDLFRFSGAVPTGPALATNYYVLSTGFTPYSFRFSTTPEGTAVNASGTAASTGVVPVNSWNLAASWIRIQDPGGGREICIQHNNAGGARVKVSTSAKFSGSWTLSTVPAATDEKVLRGAGTDAVPSYDTAGSWLVNPSTITNFNLSSAYIYRGAASTSAPYGFWFAGIDRSVAASASRGPTTAFVLDPVIGDSADPDPVVWYTGSGIAAFAINSSTANFGRDGNIAATWNTTPGASIGGAFAWMGPTSTAANFLYVQPAGIAAQSNSNQNPTIAGDRGIERNRFDGNWDMIPVPWVRGSNLNVTTGTGVTTGPSSPVTFAGAGTTTVTWTGHTLQVNHMVSFTNTGGALPAAITNTAVYYVISVATNTFTISANPGGAVITFATAGTGTHTATNQVSGLKGWSTLMRWAGSAQVFSHAFHKKTFIDSIDNHNWICVGAFWLPWNGTIP